MHIESVAMTRQMPGMNWAGVPNCRPYICNVSITANINLAVTAVTTTIPNIPSNRLLDELPPLVLRFAT